MPPLVAADGNVYFSTFFRPFNPEESRLDYTSFFPRPEGLAFDYLMGTRVPRSDYNAFCYRWSADKGLEPLYAEELSVPSGPAVEGPRTVMFSRGSELIAYPKE